MIGTVTIAVVTKTARRLVANTRALWLYEAHEKTFCLSPEVTSPRAMCKSSMRSLGSDCTRRRFSAHVCDAMHSCRGKSPLLATLARSSLTYHPRGSYFCGDISLFFFFNDTATTEIYTLSLHDALPI